MPTLTEVEEQIDTQHPSNSQIEAEATRGLLKYIAQAVRAWLDDEVINNADQEGGFTKITDGHIDMQFVIDGAITNGRILYVNNGQPTVTGIIISGTATNFPGAIQVAGTQVVNTRDTGWTIPLGSSFKGLFNADEATTFDPTYDQAKANELDGRVTQTRQSLKAVIEALRNHGLLGA